MPEPITLGTEGHLGCPKCGNSEFRTGQDYNNYVTVEIQCSYPEGEKDPTEYEIDRYGDEQCYDSCAGDIDDGLPERTRQEYGGRYGRRALRERPGILPSSDLGST